MLPDEEVLDNRSIADHRWQPLEDSAGRSPPGRQRSLFFSGSRSRFGENRRGRLTRSCIKNIARDRPCSFLTSCHQLVRSRSVRLLPHQARLQLPVNVRWCARRARGDPPRDNRIEPRHSRYTRVCLRVPAFPGRNYRASCSRLRRRSGSLWKIPERRCSIAEIEQSFWSR